jgi:hypothetical protein
LDQYYKDVLLKGVDVSLVDVDSIGLYPSHSLSPIFVSLASARSHDINAIINFLELVIGVAVLCENKANFIQRIFSLDQSSQEVLKGMVERAMHRTWELQTEEEESGVEGDLGDDSAYLSSQLQQSGLPPLMTSSLLLTGLMNSSLHKPQNLKSFDQPLLKLWPVTLR